MVEKLDFVEKGNFAMSNEKILLIDGHSILNRAFYGLPDLTNREGLHTNAVYGFLNIMFRIMSEEKPDYLAVAFDLHTKTFRHEMFKEYKGTRKPMAEELKQQVPVIKELLDKMGIKIVTKEGLEADDILGTISKMAEDAGMDVRILSGDRDLLQLASDKTCIRIPKTKKGGTEIEDYFATDVLEVYGVTPTEFIDVKALQGDTSDNIPGLPGVGEKTAQGLIKEYHSLENCYEHREEIKKKAPREGLMNLYDQAVLSKKLATIVRDGDIEFELSDAKLGHIYTKEAYEYCKYLEFKNLLPRFLEGEKAKEEADKTLSAADFIGLCDKAEGREIYLGVYGDSEIFTIFIDDEGGAVKVEDGVVEAFHKAVNTASIIHTVRGKDILRLLDDSEIDRLKQETRLIDEHLKEYLLDPLRNMKEDKVSEDELLHRALEEGTLYHKDGNNLSNRLKEMDMWELYNDIELPLIYVLNECEKNGIMVKAEALKEYGDSLSLRIADLEEAIYKAAGETFNINSPKQLGVILFEKLSLPYGKKTKTGYSTAADVLEKLSHEAPIVADILEYRTLSKLKSTYAEGLYGFISEDGRIHGRFHQTVTATGRLSSSDPNLQNIPVRMELGRQIRKVFVAREGWQFIDADYSQIELRLLAHLSEDPNLINAFKTGEDIHTATASKVFHIPVEEITPDIRRNAKAVNFGIVYGISAYGLSQDLSIDVKEAADFIERYFAAYPSIKIYLDQLIVDAKKKGYAETLYKRKRPMPELKASQFMQRAFGERVAMNAPIQGTAADIMKIAMIRVYDRLKKEGLEAKLLLQVHDELLIEAPLKEVETVKRLLEEEMEGAAKLLVPLSVEAKAGPTWYEAK